MGIRITEIDVQRYLDHDEPPEDLVCPISHDLMKHPVYLAQNAKSVYSRDELAQALVRHPFDPKTRMPVGRQAILPAPDHRKAVHLLLLKAARLEKARAEAPGLSPEQSQAHRDRAYSLREQRAFQLWRERCMPAMPKLARPVNHGPQREMVGAHGFAIALPTAEPEPEPSNLLGRAQRAIMDRIENAAISLVTRAFYRSF